MLENGPVWSVASELRQCHRQAAWGCLVLTGGRPVCWKHVDDHIWPGSEFKVQCSASLVLHMLALAIGQQGNEKPRHKYKLKGLGMDSVPGAQKPAEQ